MGFKLKRAPPDRDLAQHGEARRTGNQFQVRIVQRDGPALNQSKYTTLVPFQLSHTSIACLIWLSSVQIASCPSKGTASLRNSNVTTFKSDARLIISRLRANVLSPVRRE